MNGIVININPVIFHLGAFELRWYSLAIILAIIAAVLITTYRSKKKGIASEAIYSLLPWVLIGGIIGARLLHVLDYFDYYANNPQQILQIQQGGLAIWGAMAGGAIATFAYAKVRHIRLGSLIDALAPALLTAQMIGRFGCIINGDAYGGMTTLPWGFVYTHPDALIPPHLLGLPTHPYPVYEIIWNTIVLLIILRLDRHFKKAGLLFLSYLSLYSLGRFVLSFVRQENAILWGLQQSQIVALIIWLISLIAIIYLTKRKQIPEEITQR